MKTLYVLILCVIAIGGLLVLQSSRAHEVDERGEHVSTSTTPVTETEQKDTISIYPGIILPGDPVFITVHSSSTPTEILFDGRKLSLFMYQGVPRAVVAIDFNEKDLNHEVSVTLSNDEVIKVPVTITPREKIELPLGIPDKLGGNTPEASKVLVSNLAKENAEINNIETGLTQLWTERFSDPLSSIFVTDDYGYDRKTVGQTIVHKGTDFRAAVGTEVRAMNDGVVRLARTYTVYGNSIIIDHGLGVQTLYMHLSKIDVKEGDVVKAGQVIGKSGMTGYAEAAHLHISVKIDRISIDPMVFMGFWE
jgi:hypothetical protein